MEKTQTKFRALCPSTLALLTALAGVGCVDMQDEDSQADAAEVDADKNGSDYHEFIATEGWTRSYQCDEWFDCDISINAGQCRTLSREVSNLYMGDLAVTAGGETKTMKVFDKPVDASTFNHADINVYGLEKDATFTLTYTPAPEYTARTCALAYLKYR